MTTQQTQATRDKAAYRLARQFLLSIGMTEDLLAKCSTVSDDRKASKSLETIYRQFLESAQSANMKRTVIGGSIGGVDKLGRVLCRFSPSRIVKKYGTDHVRLLADIDTTLKPRGKIRCTSRSIWPQFCRAALSGAAFLSQFASPKDFCQWVDFFDKDDRARASLPMLLDREIHGLGFALACDFLKELGFLRFCKPDVHLKKILPALNLSDSREDYQIFKSVVRIAKNNKKTPFEIDKLFWMIGSGRIHDDNISVGRHADNFIAFAQTRIL